MSDSDTYPGRMIPDSERTPRGLGWEHRRRGWRMACPFSSDDDRKDYARGYREFRCGDDKVNHAMLERGVPIEKPVDECGD